MWPHGNDVDIMKKILAVCGRRRCGKDTLAVHMESKGDWVHMKVSSTLKSCMSFLFNLTHAEVEGDLKDVILDHGPGKGTTPRRLLQWMGTDVMQYGIQTIIPSLGRNFWIDHLVSDIKGVLQENNVVISDIRFLHELDRLNEMFPNQVVCVYIQRMQRHHAHNSTLDQDVDRHESESNVDVLEQRADHVIINQGFNLYDYIQEIETVVKTL
jgi:hypothetical protein